MKEKLAEKVGEAQWEKWVEGGTHLAEPAPRVVPRGTEVLWLLSSEEGGGEDEGQRCDEQEGESVLPQPLQLSHSGRGRSLCPQWLDLTGDLRSLRRPRGGNVLDSGTESQVCEEHQGPNASHGPGERSSAGCSRVPRRPRAEGYR